MNKTYTEKLNLLYETDFADSARRMAEYSDELLNWALTSLLLGKTIEQGKEWLHSQLNKPPFENKPVANFFKFVNLAAVQALFGEIGNNALQNALDLIPVVEKELMFDTDEAIFKEKAISLWMLSGNEKEVNIWREKRLAQEIYEGWKASAFEILYSSGNLSSADSLDNLARATARVSVKTLYDRNLNSVAPMVLALAAHCAKQKESLAGILYEKIFAVDKNVFGAGKIPYLIFDKPTNRFIAKDSDTIIFRVSQQILGRGKLSTGDHEIASLTTNLSTNLANGFEKRKDQDSIKSVEVEGILKFAEDSGIDNEQFTNLERRMSIAIEQAIQYLEIFDKKVSFKLFNR